MSVARGSQNAGHYYSNIVMPYLLNTQFTVAPADSGGLGITSLKSNGWVRGVFMHTTATPGVVDGITNPNPPSGYAVIQFKQNFNYYLSLLSGFISSYSGSAASVTAGSVYVITAVGTTTTAQWVAAGLQPGLTPQVGQAFVAIANGAIGGTGTVGTTSNSGITAVEVIGLPNASINNSNIASNGGAYVLVQFLASGSPTAPAAGSIASLGFWFDRSSVTVDGL